jgi:hypothetical protein
MTTSLPWWRTDVYDTEERNVAFMNYAGPKGTALVRVWPDGRTDTGWGLTSTSGPGFMEKYMRGEFDERRILYGYRRGRWAYAYVMRSVLLVCIDIDGKNGGLDHAKRLGVLPPTMAETSKSGDGYHLFYVVDDKWDAVKGYGLLNDRIGVEQGVDFRATGCVYHYDTQRWNGRQPAKLPDHLFQILNARDQKIAATAARITKVLANEDEMEVLMMHDEIIDDLKKPMPQGKRNQTLFAIGSQMQQAQIPGWEELLQDRALDVGLPADEVAKLVANINKYGLP